MLLKYHYNHYIKAREVSPISPCDAPIMQVKKGQAIAIMNQNF